MWQVGATKAETHSLRATVNPPDDLTSYNEVPYPPYSFPATHIARFEAIGRIFELLPSLVIQQAESGPGDAERSGRKEVDSDKNAWVILDLLPPQRFASLRLSCAS